MSALDIHNAVPREFKPRWGQLSLKFDGTVNNSVVEQHHTNNSQYLRCVLSHSFPLSILHT